MQALIFVLLSLIVLMLMVKGMMILWHKMHALVGIEVGHPRESLLLPYQQGVPVPPPIDSTSKVSAKLPAGNRHPTKPKKSRHRYWQTRHGNIHPLHCLTGVDVQKLDRMPKQAVMLLVTINERVAQYITWQQQSQVDAPNTVQTHWLTEKQFVIERLVNQTIPEAVNQYDQLARFSPQRLTQPIHDTMTAGDILIAVLQTVDIQLVDVLDEAFHQASTQLATTYRYVKTRTL